MEIAVRAMLPGDINEFPLEFAMQGWDKPVSQFMRYYDEQTRGLRRVFVGTADGKPAGYATLLPRDKAGPFRDKNIPVVVDFNVLEKYQRHGIGTAILDEIEACVAQYSPAICLGVGLHSGYGPAQRLYVKRGYVPDGSGVWYKNELLGQYAPCANDDELVLYMSKELNN